MQSEKIYATLLKGKRSHTRPGWTFPNFLHLATSKQVSMMTVLPAVSNENLPFPVLADDLTAACAGTRLPLRFQGSRQESRLFSRGSADANPGDRCEHGNPHRRQLSAASLAAVPGCGSIGSVVRHEPGAGRLPGHNLLPGLPDWKGQSQSFTAVAAWQRDPFNVTGGG